LIYQGINRDTLLDKVIR